MSISQKKFSPAASRVFSWAKNEAKRLQSPFIEPEHILLGLLNEKKGIAYFAINAIGENLAGMETQLREKLEKIPSEDIEEIHFSESTQNIIEKSVESANLGKNRYLGTEHLLLGLLREMGTDVYTILRKFDITYPSVLEQVDNYPAEILGKPKKNKISSDSEDANLINQPLTINELIGNISPIFLGMIGITVFTGLSAYHHWGNTNISIFYFVTFGWIISLSLHEFGHAITAYLGGDDSVIEKGYLSLNPLKYTHGFLSIVLPLVFLAMGGIGLPGGAVFINMEKIPNKWMKSLVSLAGPLMNIIFALILSIPFLFQLIGEASFSNHWEFWAGLGFLVFIQITAVLFNLFPLPGLDGFGIIRPFLPNQVLNMFMAIRPFSLIILFYFFVRDSGVGEWFWELIFSIINLVGIPRILVGIALELYRFWQ